MTPQPPLLPGEYDAVVTQVCARPHHVHGLVYGITLEVDGRHELHKSVVATERASWVWRETGASHPTELAGQQVTAHVQIYRGITRTVSVNTVTKLTARRLPDVLLRDATGDQLLAELAHRGLIELT